MLNFEGVVRLVSIGRCGVQVHVKELWVKVWWSSPEISARDDLIASMSLLDLRGLGMLLLRHNAELVML